MKCGDNSSTCQLIPIYWWKSTCQTWSNLSNVAVYLSLPSDIHERSSHHPNRICSCLRQDTRHKMFPIHQQLRRNRCKSTMYGHFSVAELSKLAPPEVYKNFSSAHACLECGQSRSSLQQQLGTMFTTWIHHMCFRAGGNVCFNFQVCHQNRFTSWESRMVSRWFSNLQFVLTAKHFICEFTFVFACWNLRSLDEK